jgi:putative membrane protein
VAPTEPSADALQHHAALEARSGTQFDAMFLEHMADSHGKAVEAYGEQTHANPNEALADFASKTLPVLQQHLATAQMLQRTLGGSTSAR